MVQADASESGVLRNTAVQEQSHWKTRCARKKLSGIERKMKQEKEKIISVTQRRSVGFIPRLSSEGQ